MALWTALLTAFLARRSREKEYDVYVNDPQPLDEGEEKHVISAFVADESGMINRVAGVFARRGECCCWNRISPGCMLVPDISQPYSRLSWTVICRG